MLCTRCGQLEAGGTAIHGDLCPWCATIAQVSEETEREEQAAWAREMAGLRTGLAELERTEDERTLRTAARNVGELLAEHGGELQADHRALLEAFAQRHREASA